MAVRGTWRGLARSSEARYLGVRLHGRIRETAHAIGTLGTVALAATMAGGGDYGEVRVPGGAEAVSFWERLVDASPSDPGRFVERLFARSSGRVAQAYHMVSRLPERQQRFVLGSWRADERNRRRGSDSRRRAGRVLRQRRACVYGPGPGSVRVLLGCGRQLRATYRACRGPLSRRWAAGTRHAGSRAPGGALLGERRPWVR